MPRPAVGLVLAFALLSAVQKLVNNYEGLPKVLVRQTLVGPADAGGLALTTVQAGAFLTAAGLGYYIKPLLGAVTDTLPVFGYRRKSWLVLASLGTSLAWLAVALGLGGTAVGLLAALLAVNLTVTFADVVCDGLMVQAGQDAERDGAAPPGGGNRRFQSAQWLGALGAMLVAAVAGGLLARYGTLRSVAVACAALPGVAAGAALVLVKEKRLAWDRRRARHGFRAVGVAVAVGAAVLAMKQVPAGTWFGRAEPLLSPLVVLGVVLAMHRVPRELFAPAALVILWPCLPFKADSQYFYRFATHDSPELLAALETDPVVAPILARLAGWVGGGGPADATVFYGTLFLGTELLFGLLGLAVVSGLGARLPLARMLTGTLVGWVVTLSLYAGLTAGMAGYPTYWLLCAAASGFVLWAGNLATLFYAAARVKGDDQATTFALLMGLSNLGGMFGVETAGSALYAEAGGLPAVLLASAAHVVLLAGAVWWLRRRGELAGGG